jgi:hypothetical protein
MDGLTQDFARYYTAVERETRQEIMYREAAPHGTTPRQALLGGDQEVGDYSAHYDDRMMDVVDNHYQSSREVFTSLPPRELRPPIGDSHHSSTAERGGHEYHVSSTEARRRSLHNQSSTAERGGHEHHAPSTDARRSNLQAERGGHEHHVPSTDARRSNLQAERGGHEYHVPPTEARRNITSRRSRGRNEEPSKEPSVLMTKRSKSQSKDVEYRREIVGAKPARVGGPALPGPEMLRRCKARMSAEMQHRTDLRVVSLTEQTRAAKRSESKAGPAQPTSSVWNDPQGAQPRSGSVRLASSPMSTPVPKEEARRVPFLTRTIPAEYIAPQIHNDLINLMAMRHQYQEDVEEARQDGNEETMHRTQQRYNDCNTRMHVIYERYLDNNNEGLTPTASGHDSSPDGMNRPAVQGSSASPLSTRDLPTTSPQHFVDVDDLPVLSNYSPTRLKPETASNAHSPSSAPFVISFVHLDEDISMNVWNAMLLFHLFTFAWQWLLQEFEFHGAVDDIELVRSGGTGDETYLPRGGYVQDVSIYANE